jgi:F0F1-type ATP synthase membrane subunit b/b'
MHEPVLVPDYTIFIQVALFFATYFVLNSLVFKPYLALLKKRREQTIGLKEAAERDRAKAEELRGQYESFLKAEKKKIAAWADEERKKIQDDERTQIQSARDLATKANEVSRSVLAEETKKARSSLEASVNEFSSAIVSKMLGRKIQVSSSPATKSANLETQVPT